MAREPKFAYFGFAPGDAFVDVRRIPLVSTRVITLLTVEGWKQLTRLEYEAFKRDEHLCKQGLAS